MNYFPFHVGDYTAHTAHLEPMEDLAYRRMLDLYYLRETALPSDPAEVARLVRLRQHAADVANVLKEFFILTEGGWINERCDEEILRMQDKQAKAKASAERTLNERQTDVELPTPTPTPTPVNTTPPDGGVPRKRSTPAAAARPDDVSEPVWQDFQRLRREKRAPLTDTALAGVRREAEKAGVPLEVAVAYCCEAGWQGFNAGWYAERNGAARGAASGETAYQRSMRERVAEVAPAIARKAPGATAMPAIEFFNTVEAAPALRIGSHA